MNKHTRIKYPNRLRYYRKLAGLTKLQVAQLLGITKRQNIGRWERGEIMPSANNLLKMRHLYNVDVSKLYGDHYQTIEKEIDLGKQNIKFEPFEPDFPIDR